MLQEIMPFLTAIAIGLLIGIERERSKSLDSVKAIFGARTMPLIALLGALSSSLEQQSLAVISGIFLIFLILVNHVSWKFETSDKSKIGATTAVAAILTFILGYMTNFNPHLALILTIFVFGFLAVRKQLRSFAQTGITEKEMNAALTFLVSAIVVLPLLPDRFIDPWQLIHPTRIWFLFVVIAGIEFASYIMLKQTTMRLGFILTGLMGGFVSATAVTLNLAKKMNESTNMLWVLSGSIVLADIASLFMQIVVIAIIAPSVALTLSPFFIAPILIGLLIAFVSILSVKANESTMREEMVLNNPISLKSTLTFALLISGGLILITVAQKLLGDVGVFITSALGGIASLRVVTFSVSELASSEAIQLSIAALAIVIGMTTNIIFKLFLVQRAGGAKLFLTCTMYFTLMLLGSYVTYALYQLGLFELPTVGQ